METRAEERAEYMALVEEVLAWNDMTRELRARLEKVVETYGDPLRLTVLMAEVLEGVKTGVIHEDPFAPYRRHKNHIRTKTHDQRETRPTRPLDDIVQDMVVQYPGRTQPQLRGRIGELPEGERFHPPTISSVLTRLVRGERIVRVMTDTERGMKYYAPGAVPADARVVPPNVDTSRLGRDSIASLTRPPTREERLPAYGFTDAARDAVRVEGADKVVRLPDGPITHEHRGMSARRIPHLTGGFVEGAEPDKREETK